MMIFFILSDRIWMIVLDSFLLKKFLNFIKRMELNYFHFDFWLSSVFYEMNKLNYLHLIFRRHDLT